MLRTTVGPAALAVLLLAMLVMRPGGPPGAVAQPPAAAAQPAKAAPADLALVPADAVGFVHVRLADLWQNDMLYQVRKTWEAAGQKALKTLDDQFVPAPSSLSRVTAFLMLDPESGEPQPFVVIAFSKPFDPEQMAGVYLKGAETREVGGKTVYTPRGDDVAVVFPADRHVLIGVDRGMDAYLSNPVAKDGPLSGALALAAEREITLAGNISALPIPPGVLDELLRDVPTDVRPILSAKQVLIAVDLGDESKLEVKATYADETAAKDAETSIRALVAQGRQLLARQRRELEQKLYAEDVETPRPPDQLPDAIGAVFGIGALNRLDGLLADPDLVIREGNELAFTARMPKEVVALAGVMAPAVLGVGMFSLRSVDNIGDAFNPSNTASQNNLKQIGLAIHNYEATHGKLPEDVKDENGKPILSWRVAILPFIEQDNLYKQFNLDEPWDSEHNRPLSETVVKVYMSPNVRVRKATAKKGEGTPGQTDYVGVSGPDTIFDPKGNVKITSITDGTSNTVMVVETDNPIPWAKPGDLVIDPNKPLPKISASGKDGVTNMLFGDGSVRKVDTSKVSERTLRNLFLRNDGNVIDYSELDGARGGSGIDLGGAGEAVPTKEGPPAVKESAEQPRTKSPPPPSP